MQLTPAAASYSTEQVGGVAFYQSQPSIESCFVTTSSNGGKGIRPDEDDENALSHFLLPQAH